MSESVAKFRIAGRSEPTVKSLNKEESTYQLQFNLPEDVLNHLGPDIGIWLTTNNILVLVKDDSDIQAESRIPSDLQRHGSSINLVTYLSSSELEEYNKGRIDFVIIQENLEYDFCVLRADSHSSSEFRRALREILDTDEDGRIEVPFQMYEIDEETSSGGRSLNEAEIVETKNVGPSSDDETPVQTGEEEPEKKPIDVDSVGTTETENLEFDDASNFAEFISLFASDTKLYIYLELMNERSASEIADEIGITRQAVYNHIREFKRHNLVESRSGSRGHDSTNKGKDTAEWLYSGFDISKSANFEEVEVVVTEDIGSIVAVDGNEYSLTKGNLIEMPRENAKILLDSDSAVRLDRDAS